MLSRRTVLLLAVAAGLVTAPPAVASTTGGSPAARASGGDVPPVIPGIVRTRVKRTEAALDRLSGNVDDGDAAAATRSGQVIRRQLSAAWRGAKYSIKHAPPPADEARVHPPAAHAGGDGPAAPVAADPPTVALAVFALQDDVVSGIVGLLDGADAELVSAMRPVLTFALDGRDAAIQDVHALAPAPSADDSRVPTQARAAGAEVVNTFDTVMPQVPAMLDDEVQQIDALNAEADDLQPSGRKLMSAAKAQILLTERQVNAYWPPVSDED
jgi:hypothetical protein